MKKKMFLFLHKVAVFPFWKKTLILLAISVLISFLLLITGGIQPEINMFFAWVFIAFALEIFVCVIVDSIIKYCIYNYWDKKERKEWKEYYENRNKARRG